jgi:hypothetical protein
MEMEQEGKSVVGGAKPTTRFQKQDASIMAVSVSKATPWGHNIHTD